ncbi:hypothetical protein HKCCSP123_11860 [Rhodobacterales bacterium HKCCSP123]|nr:hypothetical protein [Rhodobacterales bacterium HKCCSP123]
MDADRDHTTQLRPPAQVMRLSRLGSLHQCRLSFMRQLTRRMARESWRIACADWRIDASGVGHAVYTVTTPRRSYALVAFAHDLPPDQRSDRVIAEAWDATFALVDGVPDTADIARLAAHVPLQEAGRISERELCLSRANRSVRLWDHVVERLAAGRQPDADQLAEVGYLMRTTAVYGSGKFGAADRVLIEDRPELHPPFQAEMLTVYLIRVFVRDLVEHMARARGGDRAARLDPTAAEALGIGNSTGLGMAPFLVNHPCLLNNWVMAREEAIARVRALGDIAPMDWQMVADLARRMRAGAAAATSRHPLQAERNARLAQDLDRLIAEMAGPPRPWADLLDWSAVVLGEEGQEALASLVVEPYGRLVDGLAHCMSDTLDTGFRIDGTMPLGRVRQLIAEVFGWALDIDWTAEAPTARAWYVSEEKLEPRLGQRHEEPIADYEQPLATARDAALAHSALSDWPEETPVAAFLLRHPEHRVAVRRAQISAFAPYSEIRDNLIGAELMPIDMLRAKLSFFGATDFDPRSDRWVRIRMFAGAPYPETLTPKTADFWVYPGSPP